MTKIWSYISAILAGVVVGIIVGAKWLGGDDYKAYIRKVKQKGKENSRQNVDFVPILGSNGESNRNTQLRREKRLKRKSERKLRRLNKK